MSEENILVEPSAENGNIPVDAPREQPIEPTNPPMEINEETVKPAAPQLFDLPDGRKVDAETLAKEWKDNFLPEFTRKSQTLAEIERAKEKNISNEVIEDPYAKPDYIPKSYAEVINEAKQRAIEEIKAEQQSIVEQQQAVEQEVTNQVSELKKIDQNLDENALFLHANQYLQKYGVSFPDLKSAYQHMQDVASLTKSVQEATVKNIAKRQDPVSMTQGRANGSVPNPAHYTSAREYYQAIKGSQ